MRYFAGTATWPSWRRTRRIELPWPVADGPARFFTINLDAVGNMPCNPAIGARQGPSRPEWTPSAAKWAGRRPLLQSVPVMLNAARVPVHSLRPSRPPAYQEFMKQLSSARKSEAEAAMSWTSDENGTGLRRGHPTRTEYAARAAFWPRHLLKVEHRIGRAFSPRPRRDARRHRPQRRFAPWPALRRFKTGTPPRVNARSST